MSENLEGQLAAEKQRTKDLAGYQKEAVDSRDIILRLSERVAELTAERDQALKLASNAEHNLKSLQHEKGAKK